MDRRLLKYYDRELRHLQGMAKEFARDFPKIAGRLSIDDFPCADPYVERLLEGFAFLAARVQLKLESEFPRFTQNLLETVYPHYLAPTPSMAVVEITPDHAEGGLSKGFTLPRGTILRGVIGPGERTSCEYRTGHALTLWPTKLAEARYYTRDVGLLGLAGAMEEANPDARAMGTLTPAKSALRLRVRATAGLTFDKMDLDDLTIYLRGADATPMRLYEQIIAHGRAVVVRAVKGEGVKEDP
ncbi:MAG: type VI secretion system baseplate subunit TssF, partial [Phycisphaerae bacterium]|nr:type VI secretion system baseplate subunit TssF [Phycisphaerae bacterium]